MSELHQTIWGIMVLIHVLPQSPGRCTKYFIVSGSGEMAGKMQSRYVILWIVISNGSNLCCIPNASMNITKQCKWNKLHMSKSLHLELGWSLSIFCCIEWFLFTFYKHIVLRIFSILAIVTHYSITAGQQVELLTLHRGHDSWQIKFIIPGCPRPSIAL